MAYEIDEEIWTPKRVGDCLVEAIKWAQQTGGRVRPASFGSGLPDPALSADERLLECWPSINELEDIDPPKALRRQLSPAKVSQLERVLLWPMTYLVGFEKGSPGALRVFRVWVACRINKSIKFDAACDERKWSRATAYRSRDKVLSHIAQGLTKDQIRRGQH